MAKPISFTKRDLEKKKQEKRLAKQQKKEERKSNGTSSFEDMIAYVDENGMITDTPPTPNNKPQEVDMSTIEVSTPRRTEEPIELVHEGRIEHFNVSKGYGFVKDLKNAEKYFFHISGLIDNIIENNIVTFELEKGSRGMNAVKIKLKKQFNPIMPFLRHFLFSIQKRQYLCNDGEI